MFVPFSHVSRNKNNNNVQFNKFIKQSLNIGRMCCAFTFNGYCYYVLDCI